MEEAWTRQPVVALHLCTYIANAIEFAYYVFPEPGTYNIIVVLGMYSHCDGVSVRLCFVVSPTSWLVEEKVKLSVDRAAAGGCEDRAHPPTS